MKVYPGVAIGIVKSLDDPEGEGRIQVEFPWLSDKHQSAWAPIATLMAGKERGSYFMPEIDDEVLAAFEHGDISHPFIIGFLWNGIDKQPNSDINPSVRRIKTVSGHIIDFDDNAGSERIFVKTSQGHEIEMKDSPGSITIKTKGEHVIKMEDTPGSISIETKGKHVIKMEDTPGSISIETKGKQTVKMTDMPAKVSITTTAQNTLEISDMPPGIKLSAPLGMLNIQCMQATVAATSILNITAPMTVFTGVVKTPLLLAEAVVGSAYTPAPGNFIGL
jgi:phage baseplate assembly protein gpV